MRPTGSELFPLPRGDDHFRFNDVATEIPCEFDTDSLPRHQNERK